MQKARLARRMSRRSIVSGGMVLVGAIVAACSPAAAADPDRGAEAGRQAGRGRDDRASRRRDDRAGRRRRDQASRRRRDDRASRRRPRPAPPAAAAATKPAAAAAPAAAAPGAKGQVELRIHDWAQDPNDKFYGPLFKKFEEEHPNIKIEREWFPRDEMHAKELALAATGQIGDTVRINVRRQGLGAAASRTSSSALALHLEGHQVDEKDQKQFWPGNIKTYTPEGKRGASRSSGTRAASSTTST